MKRQTIKKASTIYIICIILAHKSTIIAGIKLIHTILKDFFFIQFQTKFNKKIRPVVNVEHPVDQNIQFSPEHVKTYLSFVKVLFKSASFIYTSFGKKALDDIEKMLNDINMFYTEAGSVYNRCQSTTRRPPVSLNLYFIIIHLFDPHLNCIPSLHVVIICYNYFITGKIIGLYKQEDEDYSSEIDFLYNKAIEIIESVLFIKQHSVNCISTGLFFLSSVSKEYTALEAEKFINDLFIKERTTVNNIEEIRKHIIDLYRTLMQMSVNNPKADYREILVEYLMHYDQNMTADEYKK